MVVVAPVTDGDVGLGWSVLGFEGPIVGSSGVDEATVDGSSLEQQLSAPQSPLPVPHNVPFGQQPEPSSHSKLFDGQTPVGSPSASLTHPVSEQNSPASQ
jgi:hypothetical protein